MIPYILHVTVITTICFFFYKLLLQKETFYRWNRWMLMGCLALAFLLPLLPAPRIGGLWAVGDKVASQKVVAAARPVDVDAQQPVFVSQPDEVVTEAKPLKKETRQLMNDARPTRKEAVSRPVVANDPPVKPAGEHSPVTAHTSVVTGRSSASEHASAGWGAAAAVVAVTVVRWLFYVYLFGVLIFGFNFILQLGILLFQSYSSPVIRDGRYRIVETSANRAPCSFGNTIFINPASYDWETYNQILIHEKTHVSGRHTIDILLAEVAVVCQWFNPFAWMYRREVENNLEFLTDAAVLQHEDVEPMAYQLSLLRVSAPHLPFSLTNNYNQSLLKRRIVMMNSQRSSGRTIWKYFFLLPIFTALVLLLNKPAVYSQAPGASRSKKVVAAAPLVAGAPAVMVGTSVAAAPAIADTVVPAVGSNAVTVPAVAVAAPVAAPGVVAPVPAVALAPGVAIAPQQHIAVSISPEISVSPMPALAPLPAVAPVLAETVALSDTLTDGAWFVTSSDSKLSFELKADDNDENHFWSSTLKVEKSEINPFPGAGNVSFRLVRDAGTMVFTGQFDGQQGFGHFHFQGDDGYFKALQQIGVEDVEGRRQLSFFIANVKKEFADMVVHNGYPHISGRMLISFSALHIDKEFIQYWRSSGLQDLEEPRTLITLKAQNIDKAYVEELKAAGYDHLSARELSSLRAMRVTGAYVRSMGRDKDNQMIPVRELISYKAMNIDSNYLISLRKVGYPNLDRHDVVILYNMHVTAEYIRSLQDMGFKDMSPREIVRLKSQDVSPEFVRDFKDLGFGDLSAKDLVTMKAMKVTPDFVKGFRDIGYKDLSPSRLGMLKATGVTPEFVSEFKKIGFDDIPVSMLPSLKSMGVNAEWVSKMREKGFVSKDLNKYIRLKNDFN